MCERLRSPLPCNDSLSGIRSRSCSVGSLSACGSSCLLSSSSSGFFLRAAAATRLYHSMPAAAAAAELEESATSTTAAQLSAHRQAYADLASTFDPVDFDAKAMAKLAKAAGFKYLIYTTVRPSRPGT